MYGGLIFVVGGIIGLFITYPFIPNTISLSSGIITETPYGDLCKNKSIKEDKDHW